MRVFESNPTHFIEVWRNKAGYCFNSTKPLAIRFLDESTDFTSNEGMKTVAVWKITPKQTN